MSKVLIEVKNLKKSFPLPGNKLFKPKTYMKAVDGISFSIHEGETYGLVGESGCGKSTTGRAIVGLTKIDSGSIIYNNKDICKISEKEFRTLRQDLQMVFQNTMAALNPRKRIGDIMSDVLKLHVNSNEVERREKVISILKKVGLQEEHYFRFPHELSGGQVQRLGIAIALLINPKLIVCDEPVSALDVSIQAQILNILTELKKEMNLSLLFISHDIGVIRFISDRVGVMYLGSIVEEADTDTLFSEPLHPYTKALLSSVPDPYMSYEKIDVINGEQPIRTEDFSGCVFHTRCPYAMEICRNSEPTLIEIKTGHKVACHLKNKSKMEK